MRTLFLSAGHHNNDPGAIGNGFKEADLTMEFRDTLYDMMDLRVSQGLTPEIRVVKDDDNHNLSHVISWLRAESTPNDRLVDIHFNSFTNPKAQGTEMFVHPNTVPLTRKIATRLAHETSIILETPNRGVKEPTQSARGSLGMLNLPPPTILAEIGFISNVHDITTYKDRKEWLASYWVDILTDWYFTDS